MKIISNATAAVGGYFLFAACFLFFSCNAVASATSGHASFAAKFGYGDAYSDNKSSVATRVLFVPALEGVLGIKYSYFILGISGEYSFWRQYTKVASVSNSNVQGKMFILTPVLGVEAKNVSLFIRSYPVYSRYQFDRLNALDQKQEYSSAEQTGVEIRIRALQHSFFGIEYAITKFTKQSVNDGSETAIAAGSQLNFQTYGVMYGYKF